MGTTQHWDDPARRKPIADPAPHLRADPFDQARIARSIEGTQRDEVLTMPTNFLPPEARRSWTETPQMRAEARRQLLASRPDRAAQIRHKAAFATEIAKDTTLSGRTSESRRRFDLPGEMEPQFVRRADGSLAVNWERVGPGLGE